MLGLYHSKPGEAFLTTAPKNDVCLHVRMHLFFSKIRRTFHAYCMLQYGGFPQVKPLSSRVTLDWKLRMLIDFLVIVYVYVCVRMQASANLCMHGTYVRTHANARGVVCILPLAKL